MNLNELNSKVNLPSFCEAAGIKGYSFLKIPTFGWFAYNDDYTEIRQILDFNNPDEQDVIKYCTRIIKDQHRFHEFRMFYSEVGITQLVNDIYRQKAFKTLHHRSIEEMWNGKAYSDGRYFNLKDSYISNGMEPFLKTNVGLLTENILLEYKTKLNLDVRHLRNKIILPSYCAPGVACSYEWAYVDKPTERNNVYVNGDKGWYGELNTQIVGDLGMLLTVEGCTWHNSVDLWASKPLPLHQSLSVDQCIKMWSTAKKAVFTKSPLQVIEENQEGGKVKFYLAGLNLKQILTLEQQFKIQIKDQWSNCIENEINIGRLKFYIKDDRYYVETKTGLSDEYTNFTVHIDTICKQDNLLIRTGNINHEGKTFPFELDNKVFLSCKGFIKALNDIFFDQGIGIPLILNNYRGYIIDVINRFNRNISFGE